jgi:hypothetical protein
MKVVEKTVGYYNETTGEYIKAFAGQGDFYLDYDAFVNKTDEVCYIPELFDTHYTYIDFIKIAKNNEELAWYLFNTVNWQSPETLFNDLVIDDEIDEDGNFIYHN